jgi:hypothetical protein
MALVKAVQCNAAARVQLEFMAQMRTDLVKAVQCSTVARVQLGFVAQVITGVTEAVQYSCYGYFPSLF